MSSTINFEEKVGDSWTTYDCPWNGLTWQSTMGFAQTADGEYIQGLQIGVCVFAEDGQIVKLTGQNFSDTSNDIRMIITHLDDEGVSLGENTYLLHKE